MNNPYAIYQTNAVTTLSQEDILLKLLEGAKLRVKQAIELNSEGEKIKAREKRQRALEIVTELDSTLDRENEAQDVVENLDALYGFMIREFNNATLQDSFERLQPIQEVLEDLYQGFQDAVREVKKNNGSMANQTYPETGSKQEEATVSARG